MTAREKILACRARFRRELLVEPAWGIGEADGLYVSSVSGRERDEWEMGFQSDDGRVHKTAFANVRARLLALTIRDEVGARVFSDEDVQVLGELDAGVLDRWFAVAQRLNGLRKEDVEELEKNSLVLARNGALSSV